MKPSKAIIDEAVETAKLSICRFRVGAVIYYKGSIEGEGYNQCKTHPRSPHPWGMIDAEFAAVLDAVRSTSGHSWTSDILKHCGIYVVRLKKDGSFGNAKPCSFCAKMLYQVGIDDKDIYFSEG
jgi:deoxycytidylate deaminase